MLPAPGGQAGSRHHDQQSKLLMSHCGARTPWVTWARRAAGILAPARAARLLCFAGWRALNADP
jgi:hypothetical protein